MSSKGKEAKKKRTRTRKPRHKWEQRTYQFLLEPSAEQEQNFWATCYGCWFLRGLLVNDRSANRKENREKKRLGEAVEYLDRSQQYKDVSAYQKQYPDELKHIYSQVLQNVAVRVDEGNKRWQEALQEGNSRVKPPHPIRFQKYRSFTYPQYDKKHAYLSQGLLNLPGIGQVKAVGWRRMRGLPKTVTIKFKQGKWLALISCAIQAKDLYKSMDEVADLPDGSGDPGLESLLTDSEGTEYDPPRSWHEERAALEHELRVMARKFRHREDEWKEQYIEWLAQGVKPPVPLREHPYSKRLEEQIRRVAKRYTKVACVREYYHRKLAVIIDATFRLFGIEDHGLAFMLRNRRLAKAASDRAIGKMKQTVESKIGPRYFKIPNRGPDGRGNSQVCTCGADVPKTLKDRVHECPVCGLVAGRDHVAANVGQQHVLGYASVSLSYAVGHTAGRGGSEAVGGASCGGEWRDNAALEEPQPAERPRRRRSLAESEDGVRWVRKLPANGLRVRPGVRRKPGRAKNVERPGGNAGAPGLKRPAKRRVRHSPVSRNPSSAVERPTEEAHPL